MSLEIIGIGYNSSIMDRDCLFKVEADNGEEEEEQKNILSGGGNPTQLPLCDILIDDRPPALLSLACMFGEALKTNEKESYMTRKLILVTSKFLISPPPSKKVLNFLYPLHGDVINV